MVCAAINHLLKFKSLGLLQLNKILQNNSKDRFQLNFHCLDFIHLIISLIAFVILQNFIQRLFFLLQNQVKRRIFHHFPNICSFSFSRKIIICISIFFHFSIVILFHSITNGSNNILYYVRYYRFFRIKQNYGKNVL